MNAQVSAVVKRFGRFTALCALLVPPVLFAADWSKLGLRVVRTGEEEGRTRLLLEDAQKLQFTVSFTEALSDAEASRVVKLRGRLMGWTLGPIRTIHFLVSGPVLEALVIPERVSCGEVVLTEQLPGGLLFRESDTLEYNFRLTAQNLFVRIRGVHTGDSDLCAKLTAAAANPREYIRRRDPEHLLRTMERLKSQMDDLHAGQERLRRAVVALHNKGFFGGARPIAERAIARLLELKKAAPTLTAEQLSEKLRAEKIELSSTEAELLLQVYYAEFK